MRSSNALLGIIFMLTNTLSLSFLDMTSKYLKITMNSAHIVFLYKSILFLMILPWVLKDGVNNIKSEKLHIHLIRSFFSVAGALAFIKGLQYVSLADASALENVQYMILVMVGMFFFKESITKTKIFALIIGIIGAIIVVKPFLFSGIYHKIFYGDESELIFFDSNSSRYFGYTLLAVVFWSINSVSVKILGKTEKTKTQMFYLMLFATLWTLPFAFIEWGTFPIFAFNLPIQPIGFHTFSEFNFRPEYIILILIMAFCYFVHGVAYFNALKYDLSVVIPFRYTKLLFTALIGYYLFHETQHSMVLVGYALIVLSGLSLTRYEYRRYKYNKKSKEAVIKDASDIESVETCKNSVAQKKKNNVYSIKSAKHQKT